MNTFTIDDNQYNRFVMNVIEDSQYNRFVTDLIKTTTSSGRLERISVIKSKEEVNYIPPLGIEYKEGITLLCTLAEEYNIDTIAIANSKSIVNPKSIHLIVPYLGHEVRIINSADWEPNPDGLLDNEFLIHAHKIGASNHITGFRYSKITKCCNAYFDMKVHEDVIDIVNIASRYIEEYL